MFAEVPFPSKKNIKLSSKKEKNQPENHFHFKQLKLVLDERLAL